MVEFAIIAMDFSKSMIVFIIEMLIRVSTDFFVGFFDFSIICVAQWKYFSDNLLEKLQSDRFSDNPSFFSKFLCYLINTSTIFCKTSSSHDLTITEKFKVFSEKPCKTHLFLIKYAKRKYELCLRSTHSDTRLNSKLFQWKYDLCSEKLCFSRMPWV